MVNVSPLAIHASTVLGGQQSYVVSQHHPSRRVEASAARQPGIVDETGDCHEAGRRD